MYMAACGKSQVGNVWVFVQLIFGLHMPKNQVNRIPNNARYFL